MKLYISTGNSRMEKKWNGQEMEFSVFLERLSHTVRTSETMEQYRKLSKAKQDSIKDVGGFVLGMLKGGRRKKANVLFRSGLTLDMDYATEDIAEQIEQFFDFRCLIYSTHKHTPEKPRLRLIIPLSRTVSPDEYAAVARKVAEDIGMELFDDTAYEPSRLMYWPSTSADGEFFFRDIPGKFLNPDSVLYKGDFHLQKYYTPENKRNHTRKNNGEVQSYYISENHEPIVSPEVWEKVQEVREQRKRDRNIGQDSTMKFQNRYPLSEMLICPYCGKTLRRKQVYKKKIQWLCSTYIEKGVKACKGIRIDDAELQGLNITEQTVIEEVVKNGKKHYCYTSKADFDCGIRNSTVSAEIEDGSVLPSVNRPRRTVIKL